MRELISLVDFYFFFIHGIAEGHFEVKILKLAKGCCTTVIYPLIMGKVSSMHLGSCWGRPVQQLPYAVTWEILTTLGSTGRVETLQTIFPPFHSHKTSH